jgi:hypothetical protein
MSESSYEDKKPTDRLGNIIGIAFGIIIIVIGNLNWLLTIFGAALSIGSVSEIKEIRVWIGISKKEVKGDEITATIDRSTNPTVFQKVEKIEITNPPAQPTAAANPPFLRVTPRIVSGLGMGQLGLEADVKNLGNGVATSIEVSVDLTGGTLTVVPLESKGVFKLQPLGRGESRTLKVLTSVVSPTLIGKETCSIRTSYNDCVWKRNAHRRRQLVNPTAFQ